MTLNLNVPNNRAPKYLKQNLKELKKGIDKYSIIFGNFNLPPLGTDRTSWQKSVST